MPQFRHTKTNGLVGFADMGAGAASMPDFGASNHYVIARSVPGLIYVRDIDGYGVVRKMQPTIESVVLQLKAMEARYGIETDEFLMEEGRVPQVAGEDASDWLFLVEQLRVLKETAVENLYSIACKTGPLQNDYCSPARLAA